MGRRASVRSNIASTTYPPNGSGGGGGGGSSGLLAPVQSLAAASGVVTLTPQVSTCTTIPFTGTPTALTSLTIALQIGGAFAIKFLDFTGCDFSGVTSVEVDIGGAIATLDVQDNGGLWFTYWDGAGDFFAMQVDDNVPAPGSAGWTFQSTGTQLRDWIWGPPGGLSLTTFVVQDEGVVEVGTTVTDPTWTATANEVPDLVTLSWTNPNGSDSPTPGTSMSGTITAVFTSNTNGAKSTFLLSAIKDLDTASLSASIVWSGVVTAGAHTPAGTPGQALWNNLTGQNEILRTTIGGSFAIACSGSEVPTGAVLTSLGRLPTITDQNHFTYPATILGTSNVTENGTTQNYTFFTWADLGADATFTFS